MSAPLKPKKNFNPKTNSSPTFDGFSLVHSWFLQYRNLISTLDSAILIIILLVHFVSSQKPFETVAEILTRIHRVCDIKKRLKFITVSSYLSPLFGGTLFEIVRRKEGWRFPLAQFLMSLIPCSFKEKETMWTFRENETRRWS